MSEKKTSTGKARPSYQNLFGSGEYYAVDPARSVLSPAAYLVDLIRLVSNNVTESGGEGLRSRRPDLWDIMLDANNTDTLVSKLSIVNEILEGYLDIHVDKDLPQTIYPFNLPYNPPIAAIRAYLSHNQTSLVQIWTNLSQYGQVPLLSNALSRETLELSPEQWLLYSTKKTGKLSLNTAYGLLSGDPLKSLKSVPVFLQQTGLEYDQLNELVFGDKGRPFDFNLQRDRFFINIGKQAAIDIVGDELNKEQLSGLTATRLDHIQRFVRLSQTLDWSFTDLDWVLQTISHILDSPPVINDATLPYLAWLQTLHTEFGFSLDQCCALIGTIKDFTTNGAPSFFDRIFNNENIPNPPAWINKNGQYSLSWTVPLPGQSVSGPPENRQIQNALAAALQLSQDDLVAIGNLVPVLTSVEPRELPLNQSNLAILYRFSLLPELTGLTVKDVIIASELTGIINDLTTAQGGLALAAITQLRDFSQWLIESPFSAYQLQFILNGTSDDLALQNSILGSDAIHDFLKSLKLAIEKTRLTKTVFIQEIKTATRQRFSELLNNHRTLEPSTTNNEINTALSQAQTYVEQISSSIYSQLVLPPNQTIDSDGIVLTSSVDPLYVQAIVKRAISTVIMTILKYPGGDDDDSEQLLPSEALLVGPTQDVISTIAHYYQLQQTSFTAHISALYRVSPQMAVVLKNWGDLHIEGLINSKSLPPTDAIKRLLSKLFADSRSLEFNNNLESQKSSELAANMQQTSNNKVSLATITILRKLQQVAYLFTELSFSSSEAQFFVGQEPHKSGDLISLKAIKMLNQFKQLVAEFQDSQNKLLGILSGIASLNHTPLEDLGKLAQWNVDRLRFLVNKLWPVNPGQPLTVNHIALLKHYFDLADMLRIDVAELWQLKGFEALDAPTQKQWKEMAGSLWSGLYTRKKDQSSVLRQVRGSLDQPLRDRLVTLSINQLRLRKQSQNLTSRGLYEYFLIDVEVSSVVQTSVIKEALSAVQLYIYRCLNNLERSASVNETNLAQLWSWMYSYRLWQANREVFLFPEDYIQPELRKNQTSLFARIDSDLKQANLSDPQSVEDIFNVYMNGFAEIANLTIVGSSARDHTQDGVTVRELCLVGVTQAQPHQYYYRLIRFACQRSREFKPLDESQYHYQISDWGQWRIISTQIQPIQYRPPDSQIKENGQLTPVFAFGKWYVLWVEQQQSGASQKSSGEGDADKSALFTIKLQYACLDFSQQWGSAQTLAEFDLLLRPVPHLPLGDTVVYPVYFSSIQTLYLAYGYEYSAPALLYQLTEGHLSQGVLQACRFQSSDTANIPTQPLPRGYSNATTEFIYYSGFGESGPDQSQSFSSWFNVGDNLSLMPLWGDISAQVGKSLLINGKVSSSQVIESNTWYHLVYTEGNVYLNARRVGSIALMNEFYTLTDKGAYCLKDNHWRQVDSWKTQTLKQLCSFGNRLYAVGNAGRLYFFNNGIWIPSEGLKEYVYFIYECKNTLYAATKKGVSFCNNELDQWSVIVKQIPLSAQLLCMHSLNEQLYVGTSKGLYTLLHDKLILIDTTAGHSIFPLDSFDGVLYFGLDINGIYALCSGKLKQQKGLPDSEVDFLYSYEGILYASVDLTLYTLQYNKWVTQENNLPKDSTIQSFYAFEKTLYAGTKERGLWSTLLYSINSEKEEKWEQQQGIPANAEIYQTINIDQVAAGISTNFKGSVQEVLYFDNVLSQQQVTAIYENSKQELTQNFDLAIPVDQAFAAKPTHTNILMQPNWSIVEDSGAEYLLAPYLATLPPSNELSPILNCYRLNSTAINKLSALLHQGDGVKELLTITAQRTPEISIEKLKPNKTFLPVCNYPSDQIDFSTRSAMSNYYWEVFFHAPFLIAKELNVHQQFQSARRWFEMLFNPSVSGINTDFHSVFPNDKFWHFLGLRSADNPALQQELQLEHNELAAEALRRELQNQVELFEYQTDPFDPQAIADLRPVAYQKTIVTQYISNLLDWGDKLFRQNTRESIVEAEVFYVAAYDLLGEEPLSLGPEPLPSAQSLGELANPTFPKAFQSRYFGIPRNQQFLAYWDTVKQRLYNIRHGLNIDGEVDRLPLFQPPLNPEQLIAGLETGEGLTQGEGALLNPVVPYYRFTVMIDNAKAVTQTVIRLGQSLLAALEKNDAEQLAMLYNNNQQTVVDLTRASKQEQLNAATQSIQALQANLASAQYRQSHYSQLIGAGLSKSENNQITLQKDAITTLAGAKELQIAAIAGYVTPVIFGFSDGGMKLGDAIQQGANIAEGVSNVLATSAYLSGIVASYQRRAEDWQLQQSIAVDDVNQIQSQVVAAQYQQQATQQDLEVLQAQAKQSQNVADFYLNKFTNSQLYQWYVGQISAIYFQTYQLAHKIAIQAENAWIYERIGRAENSLTYHFIQTGSWDSLHQGLLAGESLQLSLQEMEKAFYDQNQRRLEIEKTVSLMQLDGTALMELKNNGSCVFDLTEKEFDFDFPGHFSRKITSISISLPLVLGPYQNIHASLTQLSNRIVTSDDHDGEMAVKYLLGKSKSAGSALSVDINPNQQVALSHGVNDSGLFELDFNDERYLPFEGTGVVSSWVLSLPPEDNAFDFSGLTDVIIKLRYTALPGNVSFKKFVKQQRGAFNGYRSYSLAQTFAAAWQAFVAKNNRHPTLDISITPNLWRRNMVSYSISRVWLYCDSKAKQLPRFTLQLAVPNAVEETIGQSDTNVEFAFENGVATGSWKDNKPISVDVNRQTWVLSSVKELDVLSQLTNLVMIVEFSAGPAND